MMIRPCIVFVLAIIINPTAGLADDWPTWRHDRLRTGVTQERLTLPLQQVWTFHAREHENAPVPTDNPTRAGFPELTEHSLPMIAAGDAVFFCSGRHGRVVCLDAATAKVRWQFVAGAAIHRVPMFWEGRIYCGSSDGFVYCLNAKTGEVVWQFRAAPADRQFLAYGKMISAWPVQTDVLVDKGVAYFAAGVFPHEGTFLYAIDARSGKLLWRNGTQSEDSGQVSLAPGGNLYLTDKQIWVPKDFRGYSHPGYGAPSAFRRTDGHVGSDFGRSDDPEDPKTESSNVWRRIFWPLMGVAKDGVRYVGHEAWNTHEEHKNRKSLWKHHVPNEWTDADSAMGVRMKGSPVIFRYDPELSTVVYAGDTVFHAAFKTDPTKSTESVLYARDPKDGTVRWSQTVPDRVHQLIVANGRLFAATRRGTIHCFAVAPAESLGTITERAEPHPFGEDDTVATAAKNIIDECGVKAGYAVVLDSRNGHLALELARASDLSICAVFRNRQAMQEARTAYVNANLHLTRIVTCYQAEEANLPYPSFFADLIVSEEAVLGGGMPGDLTEIARLQKPIRGVALIGGKQSTPQVQAWIASTEQRDWKTIERQGNWAKRTRPPLKDGGAWSAMFGDAGHSGCSHDAVLKPPLGVTWYGKPQIEQPGNHTALVIDGILVVPQPHALEACDQYTGRRLWRIDARDVGVSLAASSQHVYSRIKHVLVQIDLHTGKERASYLPAFSPDGGWNWFAVSTDGKTVFGAADGGVFATEMESGRGEVRWAVGGPDKKKEEQIRGTFAMSGNYIYVLGDTANEVQRVAAIAQMRAFMSTQTQALRDEFESQIKERDIRQLTAINATTGKVEYRRGVDVSNCGAGWLRPQGQQYGRKRHYNPHVGIGMYVHDGIVVIASESRADKGWQMWNSGSYEARAMTAYDGKSGKLLWYKFTNHRTRPVIVHDTIHAEPWAFNLRTGEKKTRIHPITGKPASWAWCRPDKQCGYFSASTHFLFGRNKGFGYKDLINDDGLYTFWHSRSNCIVDHVSGGGLMIKPPQAIYCDCEWSLPFTVAMGQVSTRPAAAPKFAQPGSSLPVKHLRIDFGGNGDRRDQHGRLWIHTNRPSNHKLLLAYDLQMLVSENGGDVRQSARYTPVENTDTPFLFASHVVGLRRCVLPIARPGDGKSTYSVRLGFAAPSGDKPGQRVFDIKLNGQLVLKDFDIIAATGKSNTAIWKEFKVQTDTDLILDFESNSSSSESNTFPLVNAMEVQRESSPPLGLDAPTHVALNREEPAKTVVVKLTNMHDKPFSGRIHCQSSGGTMMKPVGEDTVKLLPGEATDLQLRVSMEQALATPANDHHMTVHIQDAEGKSVASQVMAVSWLENLKRVELKGGSISIRQETLNRTWGTQVKPHRLNETLHVSQGFSKKDDGGGAVSFVWFHMPPELRSKSIASLRLRLHTSPSDTQLLRALTSRSSIGGNDDDTKTIVQTVSGPPWPDFSKVTYASPPKVASPAFSITPIENRIGTYEATITGPFVFTDKQPNLYLAIESRSSNGHVFVGHQAHDKAFAPTLIVDVSPK